MYKVPPLVKTNSGENVIIKRNHSAAFLKNSALKVTSSRTKMLLLEKIKFLANIRQLCLAQLKLPIQILFSGCSKRQIALGIFSLFDCNENSSFTVKILWQLLSRSRFGFQLSGLYLSPYFKISISGVYNVHTLLHSPSS